MSQKQKQKQQAVTHKEVVIHVPVVKVPKPLQGFIDFIRTQGVVGLAVGLVLGVAAKSVIDSMVQNLFNPVIGLLYGGGEFKTKFICLKAVPNRCLTKLAYGAFLNDVISFIIIAAVVYFVVKGLKLDRLDKPKEE